MIFLSDTRAGAALGGRTDEFLVAAGVWRARGAMSNLMATGADGRNGFPSFNLNGKTSGRDAPGGQSPPPTGRNARKWGRMGGGAEPALPIRDRDSRPCHIFPTILCDDTTPQILRADRPQPPPHLPGQRPAPLSGTAGPARLWPDSGGRAPARDCISGGKRRSGRTAYCTTIGCFPLTRDRLCAKLCLYGTLFRLHLLENLYIFRKSPPSEATAFISSASTLVW